MAQVMCVWVCLAIIGMVEGDRYYSDYGDHRGLPTRRRVVTRVTYKEPRDINVVYRRRKTRPVTVLSSGFDGSYASVGGTARRGSVKVVNSRPVTARRRVVVVRGGTSTGYVPVVAPGVGVSQAAIGVPPAVAHPSLGTSYLPLVPSYQPVRTSYQTAGTSYQPVGTSYQPVPTGLQPGISTRSRAALDRLPLPKCSYINTDFPGDDLFFNDDDEPGINAGSARACKARCKQEDACSFWSYREGNNRDTFTRDCFLKEGTPGLPVPRAAVPRIGFVSGTSDNNCVCIKSEDEEDEVCPIKNPRGLVYPWKSTDEAVGDYDRDLPLLGWNRGVYGGLDPRLDPYLGVDQNLEKSVRDLRRQLDILTRTLDG